MLHEVQSPAAGVADAATSAVDAAVSSLAVPFVAAVAASVDTALHRAVTAVAASHHPPPPLVGCVDEPRHRVRIHSGQRTPTCRDTTRRWQSDWRD